jgi:hypothetical protein
MRSLCALLLAVLALPGSAYAWGTHANPDDLLDLNSQYNQFLSALEVLNLPVDQLAANRTRELLGVSNNQTVIGPHGDRLPDYVNPADYMRAHLPEVEAIFLNAGMAVIRNPSSSCPVATQVVREIGSVNRQVETLGLQGSDLPGGLAMIRLQLFGEVIDRCITEAYDLCVDSGSVQPFISLGSVLERTLQMFGFDEAPVLEDIYRRMKDCGHYQLTLKSTQHATVSFPISGAGMGKYTRDSEIELHALDIKLDANGGAKMFAGLGQNRFLGDFVVDGATAKCVGRNHNSCVVHKDWAGGVYAMIDDLRVQYHTLRADIVDTSKFDRTKLAAKITYQEYTPPGMERDDFAVLLKPGFLHLFVTGDGGLEQDQDNISALVQRDDQQPIRGWQRHGGGDLHEPVHFTLTVVQTVDDSADNGYPKQVSEVATMDLKHTPESMTPFVYTVVPLQPIRKPAKHEE